jgi:hypothetical protein
LFLEPIVKDARISPDKRELAQKLCLDTFFEYAPNITLAYDQHLHRMVQIASQDEDGNPVLGVFYHIPQWGETQTYDKQEVINQIVANLKKIAVGEVPQTYSPHTLGQDPSVLTVQNQFFVSEALAMVDRIGAMRVARHLGDETAFEQEELDYLLLLDELIGWRENLLDVKTADDFCVHNLGLAYFSENYLQGGLSEQESSQVSMHYGFGQVSGFNCNAGTVMVYGRPLVSRANLRDFITSLEQPSLGFGILEGNNFEVERNALYAGMLATVTEGSENED